MIGCLCARVAQGGAVGHNGLARYRRDEEHGSAPEGGRRARCHEARPAHRQLAPAQRHVCPLCLTITSTLKYCTVRVMPIAVQLGANRVTYSLVTTQVQVHVHVQVHIACNIVT